MNALALSLPLGDAWGMHGDIGAGWWVVMMVGMALFWGALILGVVWLVRSGFERSPRVGEETALTILDRRFADGALSADEYRERREVLVGSRHTSPGADS